MNQAVQACALFASRGNVENLLLWWNLSQFMFCVVKNRQGCAFCVKLSYAVDQVKRKSLLVLERQVATAMQSISKHCFEFHILHVLARRVGLSCTLKRRIISIAAVRSDTMRSPIDIWQWRMAIKALMV
jgi:hypothetical protein